MVSSLQQKRRFVWNRWTSAPKRRRTTRPRSASRRTGRRCPTFVLDYKPPKIEHTAAIKALQTKLAPLAALEKRGGALLSVAEVSKLGEAPDLEEISTRIATLEEASRLWYETDAGAGRAPRAAPQAPLRIYGASPQHPKRRRAAGRRDAVAIKKPRRRADGVARQGVALRGAFAALGD